MAERRQQVSWIGRAVAACLALSATPAQPDLLPLDKPDATVRIATFNASMARKGAGVLISDISKGDRQVQAVAQILRHVRPDIVLINEIDHDPQGLALAAFVEMLAADGKGTKGLSYAHIFTGPVNTGVPSGLDLDGDGRTMGPGDALGYGRFPGQYGMAVLSRFPLGPARTFQRFLWRNVPWAVAPLRKDGTPFFAPEAWAKLPLSSKSHWDVPVTLPDGRALHLLASHPTPPVFDGPENRNGLRNAAEIRFWIDYIDGKDWMVDDAGIKGALTSGAEFVVLGDLNADPKRGAGDRPTINALTDHVRVTDPRPLSAGASELGRHDATADWPEKNGPGNMRVDYVLPSTGLQVAGTGVFWPAKGDPLARLVANKGRRHTSSDHRLVWVDIEVSK